MKKLFLLLPVIAAVIVVMTQSAEVLAQQTEPLFSERFANVFDPNSRTYFSLQGTQGDIGGQQPFTSFGASHFVGDIDDAISLFSGNIMVQNNGNPSGTFGAQQRLMTVLPVLDTTILGAGLYMDFTQSRYDNVFQQLNLNLELLTESSWVARVNGYFPVGRIEAGTGIGQNDSAPAGQLNLVGTTLGYGGINRALMDVGLMGSDFEIGRKFFDYRMEAYTGYYNWNGPLAGFTNGVKGGVRGYVTNNLSGYVNIAHDGFFGTNVNGGVTYFFGGSGGNRPMSFRNLMTLPAQRQQQVTVGNFTRELSTFVAARDVLTDEELHLYFVEEGGTGPGTQSNPSSISSVLASTQFATGSTMVLVDSNGNITSPIALNHDRQQVIGGGATGTATVDFSLALGQPPGTSVINLSGLGGRPVLMPSAGDAITLTNQNKIQGFTIDGSGGATNGIVGNPGAANTVINDMLIRNVAGTGIRIQPSTNTTINNTTFQNNGLDMLLNAANSQLTNITSTGAINGSINLGGNGGDITGNSLISNVTITGAGGFGGILLNNAQNGSVTQLTNVSIANGSGAGVTVANSQAGAIYNLTNVDILNVGSTGMSLQNSNGTFNVDGTSSIANTGAAAFAVNGGAINATFNGTINQANPSSAVAVTGNHTGTLNFTASSSVMTTDGNGMQFNAANGIYNFLGTNSLNGGDAGIDVLNSTGTFVFNNPLINNTAAGMGVNVSGAAVTTFNGLNITTNGNTGFKVVNGGLTTVNGTANVNAASQAAIDISGTPLVAAFTNVTSTGSATDGISLSNVSGTFGVTGTTTISTAAGSGINIANSSGLTSTFPTLVIDTTGGNGVNLADAGTVNLTGGTINGTTGDGIHSADTNLTATGLNIGGTGTIGGDGIEIVNNGAAHVVNLSNNTITANASGISTVDSGNAGELLLTLDNNTLQSILPGTMALSVGGSGQNSTIIQSMNGGTVIGGTGGGVVFNQVTFDASGTLLSGTQLNVGNWMIGTTAARVQGDGLRFNAPTGDLNFGTLDVANNNGTGLYVDTKTLGTTFSLGNSGGTVDTTSGSALFLDPLTTNLTFSNVSSTNSATNGITLDAVAGTLNIANVNVQTATGDGFTMLNSTAEVIIGQLNVNGATNGVHLADNSAGSFTVTASGGSGGTIQNVTDRGVLAINSVSTSLNNMVIDASGGTRGVGILTTTGTNSFNLTNSIISGGTEQAVGIGADLTGTLNAFVSGNTMVGTGAADTAGGFGAITSATGQSGGTLNLAFRENTLSSVASAGAYISNYDPLTSTTGGTVTVTDFLNNTVTTSNAGGSSSPLTGGIRFNGVTFDADLSTAGNQTVDGGALSIGDVGTPTNVVGDGLQLNDVTGALAFTTMNIGNDDGTGLYVNTKLNNTSFSLTNSGGTVNTTNGAAMFLDPLNANLTFGSVSSTNSGTDGITLDAVAGNVALGTVTVTNATGSGIAMTNSSGNLTVDILNVDGATNGLAFGQNTGGYIANGATTLSNITGAGVNLNGATGNYQFQDLTIGTVGAATGIDFRNSNVTFTSANTNITGDGTAGSIGIDLSGSLNPNGANSTTVNIQLANSAGQTAIMNNVETGVLMGNLTDGSAGAYFLYGNQTPIGSGGSGSQINVITGGTTLDTTHLTSINGFTQGRYEFTGVAFTGLASFQRSADILFVGSTSAGGNDGSSPGDRISITELLTLDMTPANLDNKTIVLVNDNGGAGLNLGANTLILGDNTILDSFGNGQTFSTGSAVPVNVIVDTIPSPVVYSDANGAATLTNDGSLNLLTLGNGNTIQNVILNGGQNSVFGSGINGLDINNTTIGGSALAGISLNSTTGTIGLMQNTITDAGTSGVLLTNAGTVSIIGGTIDGTGTDGINSTNTNLTVTGITIGGTTAPVGNGVAIVSNDGTTHTVNLSSNTITASQSAIVTSDGAVANELVLTLDGNTLQSNSANPALLVSGGAINSTIVTSMNGGTILGTGAGGGAAFNQVTFDASGTALSGTQVSAGNWTIGTTAARVQGDGLRFDAPTGNVQFGTLDIANNNGTGLYVDTKTLGTSFTLGNTGGTIDTTNGAAAFLDPLTTNLTFSSLTSTGSGTNGVTLDTVSGTFNVATLNVSGAAGSGLLINNSSGLTSTFNTVAITTVGTGATDNGVTLTDAGTVSILGGTIDGTSGDGIHSSDTNLTATGLTIGGTTTITGDGIEIVNNGTAHVVNLSNNVVTGSASGISTIDSGVAGELLLTLDGNTLQSLDPGSLALSVIGSGANSTIIQSMNGGTVLGGTGGGVLFNQVTFDASGTALSGTQVTAGNWTIGTTASRVQGDGLRFDAPTGNVQFGTLDIANNNGTGLYVDTKTLGTSFTLGNTGGTIDTTNGSAAFLDPLTMNSTFSSVTSTNSPTNGLTLETVAGTLNLGNVNVTNATGSGLLMDTSTAAVTAGTVTVNGAATGLTFGNNAGGSFTATGTTNLSNLTGTGVNLSAATGTYNFADLNVTIAGANTGLDFRNSNVLFTSGNTAITGDGTAGSIGIDLSGSLNPNGANSPTSNIGLAATGGTALINNVGTGVRMGNAIDGSAGANFIYGDQTPLNSGSQINVIPTGLTLDTSHLTSTNLITQGQYNFKGVSFTGTASFQTSTNVLFVGSTSAGNDDGSSVANRISLAELLTLDANPANLDNKTIVLVNDNGGLGLDLGASTLVLGDNTTLDSFGNGHSIVIGAIPVNVIVDTLPDPVTVSDPNGAATLKGSADLVHLGNGNAVQNLILDGGTNGILGMGVAGADLNNAIIQNSSAAGVSLTNTTGLIGLANLAITGTGTDGILLANAGTVNIDLTSIDGAGAHGINSSNTSLVLADSFIGSTTNVSGDGVHVVNTGTARTVSISNTSIKGTTNGLTTTDSGVAGELVLSLNGNTYEATGAGSLAVNLVGSNLNSTIVQSLTNGTVASNGIGGGVLFNQVTFDASGTALSGTQLNGGNWTIGTNATRVAGDGLRFDAPTGDLAFGTLNLSNDNGTGLFVDTKSLGTTFALTSSDGTIDTTNGPAMFLDPLTVNLTLSSVNSTNSSTDGITLDTVAGTLNIGTVSITNATFDGLVVADSSVNTTIGTIDVNGARIGVDLWDNTGSFAVTGVGGSGAGGTLQNLVLGGVSAINNATTSLNNMVIDGSGGLGAVQALSDVATNSITVTNSTLIGGEQPTVQLGADDAGVLNASFDGNSISNSTNGTFSAGFVAYTSGNGNGGGELNLAFSNNTVSSVNDTAIIISSISPYDSTIGGPLTVTNFANNAVTVSGINGIDFDGVTFDSDLSTAGIQSVNGGTLTVGSVATPTNVSGDALWLNDVSGDIAFTTLDIGNDGGTGLFVNTKVNGTTFNLSNTGGTINTTNGAAMFLDPLTMNSTFTSVSSTFSSTTGITLDQVAGTVNIGTLNISNAQGGGVLVSNSTGTLNVTGGTVQGSVGNAFEVNGGTATIGFGADIVNSGSNFAVLVDGTTGGSTTFDGTVTDNSPGGGIRLLSNAGAVTFNGNVSLGATTALTNEAVYLTSNTGNITFDNLDVNVNAGSALGAIYGTNNSLVTVNDGSVTATGTASLNLDQSSIAMTFDSLTASGGTFGMSLTNMVTGSTLNATTTTITGVEQKGMIFTGSQGTYNVGTLDINGAKHGIDFKNSNLAFTSAGTTLTGDGSASGIAIDLSGTQNPNGANSMTPNIQLANAMGQTAIINNFGTGVKLGNIPDGSAGAYFIYGNQTPLNSGSQINVIGGGLTLDATNLTSTDPFTQGRYEFTGVSYTGNSSFPTSGADLLFVGSISSGAADGSSPTDRISLAQLLVLDATPSNLDGKTVVLVNDSGVGGGAATLDMAANTLTLGDATILDSFGNGQTFSSTGPILPVNVIADTLGGATFTDPFSNGAATLTNDGSLNVVTLGNGDTIQNVILNGGQDIVFGSGVSGININNTTFGGTPAGSAISLTNTTGTITLDSNTITNAGLNGISLANAGTVSITGGTIDNTSASGIDATNTNLTVDGVTFGSTTGLLGSGIVVSNTDATDRTVTLQNLTSSGTVDIAARGIWLKSSGAGALIANLSGNSLASTQQALLVDETGAGVANRIQLNLNGTNTWQTGSANAALEINGQNVDATNSSIVITSLGTGTITANGTGGGVFFNKVGFDSDLGTVGNQQVVAGTWNIGQGTLAAQRVQGDGLGFVSPTGDVSFPTLNVFNNGGTGLYVDAKTDGTTFNLGTGAGTIDTSGGAAMFLDPLSVNMTLTSVTSTNSTDDGMVLDTVSGTFALGSLNVTGATNSGLVINNSSGLTSTFTTVAISGVGTLVEDNGVSLTDAGIVNILGGTIDGGTGDGIHTEDSNLTATGLNIGGVTAVAGDGVHITSVLGTLHTIDLSNNTIRSVGSAIASVDSGTAGELVLTLDGNTLQSTNTVAMNLSGSALNSTIIQSMNGGTIIGGASSGGVDFNRVTFDASGTSLSGTQVAAGDWTIGTTGVRVQGDGLRFDGPSGSLTFGNLDVANNSGTGLYVDTKTLGTTFSLSNSGGTIDTTSGSAAFLDPLTVDLTFSTLQSSGSAGNGLTLDTVAGTFTVDGGTITNASNAGINIFDSSATVNVTGVVVNTNGGTGVTLNGNSGPITFTDMTMTRASGNTAFNIDATTASTGTITIDGGSSIGNSPGTAFLIGAGARDIDASALAITNDNTTTGPVISVSNLSGGTIDFGTVTNSGTTANQVIRVGGIASGTVNFGATTITNFGNASTDTAVNILGAGGMVNFADLDITTTNGSGLAMNASGLNPGSSPTIDATGGTALFLNGGTVVNGTFDSVKATNTGASNRGINIAVIGAPITLNAVDINGTGTLGNPADGIYLFSNANITLNNVHINGTTANGINVQNVGTVNISDGTIGNLSAVAGDGISYTVGGASVKTLNITDVTIGAAGSLAVGDQGIVLSSTGTGAVNATIHGGSVYATNEALATSDTGTAKQLVLSLGGTTGTQTFDRASAGNSISVVGSGLNSTIVRQLGTAGHEVIVEGGSGSGGVLFNRVTFDASGTSLSGTQVAGAQLTIGSMGTRVVGDGLRFDAPTGNLSFGNLTIFNDNGTGLYVDTKTLGTTFTLGTVDGSIDTTNGGATFLDPLTTNMTLSSLSSDNSGDNGVWLDGVAGSFTVTGTTTVTNAGTHGILIANSSATINFNTVDVDTTGADGIHFDTNTGAINFNGTATIQNTTGDGIDAASAGGGVTFGTSSITNAGANGINLGGATGSYAFGQTTINGFGINNIGVDFTGADAAATFGVTDIQNAGNGTGIDLSSTTGNKVITFATGSNISNVNLGVELSSSHTNATTANADFTFGDGDGMDGNGTNSTINATTTVNAIGLDDMSGSYNFNDVSFTGTASLPGGAGAELFVSASAVNGAGDGSFANPYSVSDADAINTDGATFVFLDGVYDFNTLNGGHFSLAKNQNVEGLDNGNTVAYGSVQPANLLGNFGASGGTATRTSSLSITDSAADGIFDLAGGNSLLDITLSGSASTTFLVRADSATVGYDNTNGISLNGVTMSNPAGTFAAMQFTNLTGNVSVQGNNINMTSGSLLNITGGSAVYTIAAGTQPDPGSTPGVLAGTNTGMQILGTTGGSVSIDGMSLSSSGTVLSLSTNAATLNFTNNTFSSTGTLFSIDQFGSSTSDLTFDNTNTITQTTGVLAEIGAGARNIDLSAFNFANSGTTAANVIKSVGQTGGTISFGNIGITGYNNAAGTAVSLAGTGGTVQFGDLDIAATSGNGLNVGGITFAAGTTPTINTASGRALILDGTTLSGGSETFDSVTSNGGFIGINLNNVTGTTTFTTVDIDNTTGRGIVLGNASQVNFNGGTVDGTADSGLFSFNTSLTVSNMTLGGTSQIGNKGIEVTNNAGSREISINSTTVSDAADEGISVAATGGTTTITSLSGNSVLSSTGAGIHFDSVTFDADTGTAGIQQVTGGNTTIGSLVTTTNVTGDGMVLDQVLGNIAFGTLNIGNDTGTGLYIRDATGKGGTFAFTNTGGTINTTNGPAMDIDPVTMNSTFASVSSTNANGQGASTFGNGINLNTIAGSVTINGGSITGATGGSFVVDSGNATVLYQGNITNTAGRIVSVANTTGGSVTFNTGTLSDSGAGGNTGTGILLSSNAGNVSFNGTTTLTDSDSTGVDIQGGSGTYTFGSGTTITSPTGIDFNVNGGTSSVTYSGGMTQATNNVALVNVQGGHNTGTLTFQTGTLSATTGTGLQFNNADGTYNFNGTTTLNGGDAGVDILNGSAGTFTFATGTSVTNPTGVAFNMDSSTAGVNYNGSLSQSNNASLVSISNQASGTVNLFFGNKTATNGNGIQLNNVDGTVAFAGTATLNGGDAGIDIINGSSGTISFSGGTGITNPTGVAFNEDTSTANVTFNGAISKTNNATSAVTINAKTGGTTAMNGFITATTTTANAINLTSNTGGTINFSNTTGGTSNLTTTSGNVFNFTGGGTLNITGNKYVMNSTSGTTFNATAGTVSATGTENTLTSTTGIALNVSNATISASDLTFQSISAGTGAGSAGVGINLDTTGTLGGLVVTGVGTTNASGGTIQHKTGADGSTTAGIGIYLNNTSDVVLKNMQLNDFDNFAIRGTAVNNLTMDNVDVSGTNGTNAAIDEGSVIFGYTTVVDTTAGITGSATISNSTFGGGSIEDTFRIRNGSGTLNRVTFDNDTFASLNPIGDALKLETANGAVVNVTVQDSFFTSAAGDLFQLNSIGTATNDLVFTGNTLTNNNPAIATGGGGVTIGGGDNGGSLTYFIDTNSFRDSDGHAILIVKSTGAGSFVGTFSNNTIGVAGTADSGSKAGSGIKVQNAGGGTVTTLITGNQIFQYNNFGIELLTGGSAAPQSGNFNATVTGNTISNPGTGGLPMNGIHLNGGTVVGDTYQIALDIGGAGALQNSINGSGANGGTDIRLRQRMATTVQLRGYTGANNDNTAVQNFLITRNVAGSTALASNTVPTGGGFTNTPGPGGPVALPLFLGLESRSLMDYDGSVLTQQELDILSAAAIQRWQQAGLTPEQTAILNSLTFNVADLAGSQLGRASGTTITLNTTAAGHTWFVDSTPLNDAEFSGNGSELNAVANGAAAGKVDAMSAIMHEIGHMLGYEDALGSGEGGPLMDGFLNAGERLLPIAPAP